MTKRFAIAYCLLLACFACNQTNKDAKVSNQDASSDMVEPLNETPLKFLALGDSYTIGESVDIKERWPVVLAERLQKKGVKIDMPEIIATTGWTTDELRAGIIQANPKGSYDLVSLLIGVNNQYRDYKTEVYEKEFKELLDTAVGFAKNRSRVFVVSIPDYGLTPFGQEKNPEKISHEIDLYNKINRNLSEQEGIQYFDITSISRKAINDPDLVAGDGLHPSGKMYSQWVDLIFPTIQEMLE